jgi:hypothetical protein
MLCRWETTMSDALEFTSVTEPVRLHLVQADPSLVQADDGHPVHQQADRAALAMLTLRLRAAHAEAEAAEQQIAVAEETARRELRRRLDALREQRREVLEAEVSRAQLEAAAMIEAAHSQARALIGADVEVDVESVDRIDVELMSDRLVVDRGNALQLAPTAVDGIQTTAVVVDIDTLARVCAMVVTEVLEQRYGGMPPAQTSAYALPAGFVAVPAATSAQKKSFWRNLLSGDVVLIGLAAAIVAVVLVAWLG